MSIAGNEWPSAPGKCRDFHRDAERNFWSAWPWKNCIAQVELYNEEMKGEILVTRRATYKAEEAVSGLEKDKGRQDLFIDRLMEQVRKTEASLME